MENTVDMITFDVNGIEINQVVDMLKEGAVFVYPTETVAGIGCVGSDKKAVQRIFKIKQRDTNKPVSYAFSSVEMIEKYAIIPSENKLLLDYLPGPLTLVLQRKKESAPLYGIGTDSIGVRIPKVPWLLELIEEIGEPVVTTSANRSGKEPARIAMEIDKSLLSEIDLLITWDGKLEEQSSTVVSLIDQVKILREGMISKNSIMEKLGIPDNSRTG